MYEIIVFFVLLSLGYIFGRRTEASHYKSILAREKELLHLPVHTAKTPSQFYDTSFVVMGNVVISIDYFKLVSAGIKSLLGGNITAYESLMDRARREATLRMKEMAVSHEAKEIINVRIETASLFKGNTQGTGCIEVFVYGTALK